ncbi:MAG: serine hydrolase [Psychroserpens sp.]|uniref:serine hydrolase n=1 Tax=Psychroserpens sp. TaxID=2020870 RepID=UPI003001DE26
MMTDFNTVNDPNIPKNTGYGLGVSRWDIGNQELWGHSGFIPGFKSITMYSPKHQYVITVLANQSNVNTHKVVEELQNVLLKKLDKKIERSNNTTNNNEE